MLKLFNYKFIKVDEVGVLRAPSSVFLKSLEMVSLEKFGLNLYREILLREYIIFFVVLWCHPLSECLYFLRS